MPWWRFPFTRHGFGSATKSRKGRRTLLRLQLPVHLPKQGESFG
jgi:hypothetical protein